MILGNNMINKNTKTYKAVNTIYALVSSKDEIYDMGTNWDALQDHCDSNNRMVNIFNDDIPFRVEEIEPNTKISF